MVGRGTLGIRAQDAELVAFGVSEHRPTGAVVVAVIGDPGGTERKNPLDLGVAIARGPLDTRVGRSFEREP